VAEWITPLPWGNSRIAMACYIEAIKRLAEGVIWQKTLLLQVNGV